MVILNGAERMSDKIFQMLLYQPILGFLLHGEPRPRRQSNACRQMDVHDNLKGASNKFWYLFKSHAELKPDIPAPHMAIRFGSVVNSVRFAVIAHS